VQTSLWALRETSVRWYPRAGATNVRPVGAVCQRGGRETSCYELIYYVQQSCAAPVGDCGATIINTKGFCYLTVSNATALCGSSSIKYMRDKITEYWACMGSSSRPVRSSNGIYICTVLSKRRVKECSHNRPNPKRSATWQPLIVYARARIQ
jgi:hypothetical protein